MADMTREESIIRIKGLYGNGYAEQEQALDMAIKALEQEPCDDCISRAKLLKIYENRFIELQKAHQMDKQLGVNWCINTLKDLPSVIPQEPKWIPIGKNGYPNPEDECKNFLTIDNKGEITIQEFLLSLDKEPQPYFTGMRNIIAWQPLPKPYKESEDME